MSSSLDSLRNAMRGKQHYLLLSGAIVVLDQWTKWLAETRLAGLPPQTVIPGLLNVTYVRNTGVAFGLFPAEGQFWGTLLLTLLGLAGFGLLATYFLRARRDERLLLASLSLVLGGAIGNLVDRIGSGAVTDFVDFYFGSYHWYTFNMADSAITIGVLLMGLELIGPRASDERSEPSPARPAQ